MRKLRSAVVGRRGNPRQRHRTGQRRFHLEQLEDRRLLAADFWAGDGLEEGEGDGAQVAVHLATTNLAGNPISSVSAGQRFLLQANVEDLRSDAAGVFAAYLDLEFDANQADILGPLVHGASFQNGVSGTIDHPGLIDEVGGFATALSPSGVAVAELFSVLVTANTVGQLVFDSGPADVLPEHAVLLYDVNTEIPIDAIDFGRVTIEVTPFGGDSDVDAFDDSYVVAAGSTENRFDVLLNDEGFGNLVVSAVDDTGLSGEVSIVSNGRSLLYSPGVNFSGTERFSYTAMDEDDASDNATVTVRVNAANSGDDIVSIRLEATDLLGTPIVSTPDGSSFLVSAYVEDTRADAEGVFAAYFDLRYNSSLIEPSGEIEIGSQFINGISGDFDTPGVVNEVGAFQQSLHAVLGGETRLFTIPFSATGAGQAVFQSDPADILPQHAVLVYGDNQVVPNDRIDYGGFTLDIISDVIAVDDSFHIAEDITVELDVLGNDVHRSDDQLRIREVDASTLRGTVSVSVDGRVLTYTPEPGFGGSEQFTYVAHGQHGVDSAQVTVHTEPGATNDDVVAIGLATTDLDGNPIDSIEAGQQFWLTASVDDLRDASLEDLGVFAAYFDLLYDKEHVSVVASDAHRLGFDVTFGTEYANGQRGRATVPGVIDEIGSFQSVSQPLGADPQRLFAVRLQANSATGGADSFVVQEDAQSVQLNVLANDVAIAATTIFRSDPADLLPVSDVLLYEPPDAVDVARIRFGETSLQIDSSGTPTITSVGRASHGGTVAISVDGQQIEYTPAPDFFGVETFTYAIDQGTSIDVEVVVEGMPDAPQASDDSYRVRTNRRLSVDASQGPLANDTDSDGDRLEAVAVAGPAHGSLDIMANGSFVYLPQQDFIGLDQFTYRAFDGGLVSSVATVDIYVEPPPVRIRLEVVDADGTAQSQVMAGETVFLKALVQDLRDESQPIHGVGAAYFDVAFDPMLVAPLPSENGEFDLAIDFGDSYQNGKTVVADVAGLLENVGAFQTGLTPLGADELDLFTIQMEIGELQVADDEFTVSMDSRVNPLDVLANDIGLVWDVLFDASPADSGPLTDVVLFDPPVVVDDQDIAFGDTTVTVSNGTDLTILSAGSAENGGSVTVVDGGLRIEYAPPTGFVGIDSFEYTVVNGDGITGVGTVTVEVVESWQNQHNRFDVNSDGQVTPTDVLILINELNRNGAHVLPPTYVGPHFFDVNGDGFISPQDVLMVLNWLNNQRSVFATDVEGEAPASRQSELAVERWSDELLPWEFHEQLRTSQLDDNFSRSTNPWQRDQIESPRRSVPRDLSTTERRWRPASERFGQSEDVEADDDLIDGLNQLADDVAQIWAMQR